MLMPFLTSGETIVKATRTFAISAALLLGVLVPSPGAAQDHYTYTISALGGFGGSLGDDDAGLGNRTLGLGLSLLREDRVHIGLRLVEIEFDEGVMLGRLTDASLRYLTAGGEYRFLESYYESGLFIGVGLYDLEGFDAEAQLDSESGVGIVLGVTGEFEINRRFGFVVEFMGHLTSMEDSNVFASGHAGIAVHF